MAMGVAGIWCGWRAVREGRGCGGGERGKGGECKKGGW